MDRKHTFSVLGVLILAGGTLGAHVGQSAIEQINPLYFQGAAVHPRDRGAAVDETLGRAQAPRFSDHYRWEQGESARSADCIDCQALAARDAYYDGTAHYAVIETGWRTEPQVAAYAVEPQPQPAPEEEEPPQQPSDIERYSSFQIAEKPGEAEPVELAAISADQK